MIDIGLLIDLYVFKKKQTNKNKKKSCKCQNQWLKREINPLTNKETSIKTKIKTKQNNNIKGYDDLKEKNELMIAAVLEVWV